MTHFKLSIKPAKYSELTEMRKMMKAGVFTEVIKTMNLMESTATTSMNTIEKTKPISSTQGEVLRQAFKWLSVTKSVDEIQELIKPVKPSPIKAYNVLLTEEYTEEDHAIDEKMKPLSLRERQLVKTALDLLTTEPMTIDQESREKLVVQPPKPSQLTKIRGAMKSGDWADIVKTIDLMEINQYGTPHEAVLAGEEMETVCN